ncbi:MAG: M18 family aminopeptidase, partial [Microthrixaceae bacterium]
PEQHIPGRVTMSPAKGIDTVTTDGTAAGELGAFIDRSPTPFHAVAQAAALLADAGSTPLDPTAEWGADDAAGAAFVVRDGSLVAWGPSTDPTGPMRLIGAHTDSPNLRVRPRPDTGAAGWRQVGVEVYGGALLNSWLDRDLGLAGRVAVRGGPDGIVHRAFRTDEPVLRVPQLAIHLDRGVNEGLSLNPQQHLIPVWGLGDPHEGDVAAWLASLVDAAPADVLGWDAACFDVQPSALLGVDAELLAAPRLDNLCSSWGAVQALLAAAAAPPPPQVPVVVLYDHEEVGSTTATGAAGAWLAQVLERRSAALGSGRPEFLRTLAGSVLLSADMAHATHPNYPERHEPRHWIRAGGGPVIKHNVNARYATDSRGAAWFRLACAAADVPVQDYSHRGDLPCGSTIGPLAAAGLAVDTVDMGMGMLSMHSARELMAAADVELQDRAFTAWFTAP